MHQQKYLRKMSHLPGRNQKMNRNNLLLILHIITILQQIMNKDSKAQAFEEQVWYVYVNNETKGPFSLRDLDVLLRTNDINSRNLAWKVGMKQWRIMNEIEQIKESILESSKEMLEIEKKREVLFEHSAKENPEGQKIEEDANNQIIQNKDQNPLTILQTTVENLIKKTFYQSTDGKWNIYDEQKGEWVQQDEQPTEKMQKMKQLLFNKLKNELFFEDKIGKRKKPQQQEQKKQPQGELTQQQLIKREKYKKKAKRQAQKRKEKWYNAKINTFVYISGLPLDVTQEELKQFVLKAGVLRIDLNTGKEKLKIYKDQNGFPKGDAAVSYAKEESVQIAIQNLNDNEIRSGFKVRVEKASFNQKEDDYKPRETKKQNLAKKIQTKMREKKLLSWDDNVEEQGEGLKIVILKYVIDPKQASSEQYLESVKKQINEELSKIGEIKRFRVYETHPDGVVQVKFQKQKDAEACVFAMNGRFYDGRQIVCDYWDGQTDFKHDTTSLLLQKERLQKFGQQVQNPDKQYMQKIEENVQQQDQQLIDKHILQEN